MTSKEMWMFIAAIITTKVFEDNLPDFHYKKVITAVKKAFTIGYLLLFFMLLRTGIIKPSPKLLLVIFGTILFLALMQWAEKRNAELQNN